MNEVEVDSGLTLPGGRPLGIMNGTNIPLGEIASAPEMRRLARELSSWVDNARGANRTGGMFDRQAYSPPDTPYDRIRACRYALRHDDVVSGAADITASIAFRGGMKWEAHNPDDADVFNQWSADVNLDALMGQMWREDFALDQYIAALEWGWEDYTVRGETDKGNKKKKRYHVWMPKRVLLLDSAFVVPVGWGPLREDRLAWQATEYEVGAYHTAFAGEGIDPKMLLFFEGEYQAGTDERRRMVSWGAQPSRLLLMRQSQVFRHSPNRAAYQLFADMRLESVFDQLDLKRQQMLSDRATLVGSANYILLIRKGSDQQPATQDEIDNLKKGYQFLARLPVIISDHRLEVDIIAPKTDFTLRGEAYDLLDDRIRNRVLEGFTAPGRTTTESGGSFYEVMCGAVERRRLLHKRSIEGEIARAVVKHPKNEGKFESRPSIAFMPGGVHVGVNQGLLSSLLTLRTQRELSRETILETLGLDQSVEAMRVELEEERYDDIFKTQIPFAAPGAGGQPGAPGQQQGQPGKTPNGTPEAPAVSGKRGGRPPGGGSGSQSPSATSRPKTGSGGNPTTRPKAEETD